MLGGARVGQIPSPCGVRGETAHTAQEDLKSVKHDKGLTFSIPAFQDPPGFFFCSLALGTPQTLLVPEASPA